MSEAFEAECYLSEKPDIKQGDSIRIEEGGKMWRLRVDEPVVPEIDWENFVFRGYRIAGRAILESEEPERYWREWPQPED